MAGSGLNWEEGLHNRERRERLSLLKLKKGVGQNLLFFAE
jgi:hypothetical protein